MSRFVPNRNLDKEIEKTPAYRAALAESAKPAEELAKTFAPVLTGAYRDSINIELSRYGVRLQATNYKANWIEYGTSKWHAHAPLRRGSRAAGRFRESSPKT